ncbi:rRNA methylase [Solibacillus silvestris StLB046]|uniref:rRNA methylase n=1 Tax=Solibacillus silvestris (strain StLB046) TaxID=1002809 RepID=F2F3B4_SOLSS|nr:23S rRNA (guanosine(2251)-2'-O)-methyltransferase RlmB [Solibacillus silvestris]OBW50267.1 23S rRNA (guanosine(2251)-2'-O)-methyltransferase RlmB [Solibacillus silvestris]BAK14617.1 rRNA methylase [Solibacillus silvestris StLB046]
MAEKRQPNRKPRDFKGRDKKADTFKTHEKKQQEKPQSAQEELSGEMIAGKNPVLEALRAGREINKLWIAEGVKKTGVQELMDLAKEQGVLVQFVPKQKVDKLAENHQGIVASVAAYDYAELDDLFAAAKAKSEDPFFLILDELEDPHNLGSIMRTADAIGAHGIIIPKRRAVGLTAVVAKASTGAIEHVPVVRVTNLAQTVDELKDRGVWIAGTDAKGSADYRKMDATLPLALIIGSEGKGMSRLLKDKCDFLYHLPMVGHVTSLNASVAAALLMYEVYRKRQEANG